MKLKQLTLLNPKISPLRIKGKIVLFIKFDKNTLTNTKLYYFGFDSGLSNFSAIILTITIKIIFVTVDNKDAPI